MAQTITKRLNRLDYRVLLVCPGPASHDAARLLLDSDHEPPEYEINYDYNIYSFGEMARHNVVIASTIKKGIAVAAVQAGPIFGTFPNIKFVMLVGIAGGVPRAPTGDKLKDIHLGDVVIGLSRKGEPPIVHFDSGVMAKDFELISPIGAADPDLRLLSGLNQFLSNCRLSKADLKTPLAKLQNCTSYGGSFKHPGIKHDILYQPDHSHVASETDDCDKCGTTKEVKRAKRLEADQDVFVIHEGRIASGSSMVENAIERDEISKRCGGIDCIEISAAGISARKPCLVIRGISDYCDSHHHREVWGDYAAAKAFAASYALLATIPPDQVSIQSETPAVEEFILRTTTRFVPGFRGFDAYCVQLKELLVDQHSVATQCRTAVLYGQAGSGKSAICDYFYWSNRNQFWGAWRVDGTNQASIVEGYLEIAKALRLDGISQTNQSQDEIMSTIISHLNKQEKHWLLIFENLGDATQEYDKLFPESRHGSIIVTSRHMGALLSSHSVDTRIEVGSLSDTDAMLLLRHWIVPFGSEKFQVASALDKSGLDEILLALSKELDSLPLALRLAGGFLSHAILQTTQPLHQVLRNFIQSLTSTPKQPSPATLRRQIWAIYSQMMAQWQSSSEGDEQRVTVEAATELLQLFSFLTPDHIDLNVLEHMVDDRPDSISGGRASPYTPTCLDFESIHHKLSFEALQSSTSAQYSRRERVERLKSAVAHLRKYYLVDISWEQGSGHEIISMSPLLQACVQENAGHNVALRALVTLSRIATAVPRNAPVSSYARTLQRSLLPHYRRIEKIKGPSFDPPFYSPLSVNAIVEIQLSMARAYFNSGLIDEARVRIKMVLTWLRLQDPQQSDLEPTLWKTEAYYATFLHDLDGINERFQALGLRYAIHIRWTGYIKNHVEGENLPLGGYLASLSDLADSYDSLGHQDDFNERSIVLRQKALRIWEDRYPDHFGAIEAKGRLGRTYYIARQRDEALKLREEICGQFEIWLKQNQSTDMYAQPDELHLIAIEELAQSLDDKGFFKKALSHRQTVWERRKQVLHNSHPDTIAAESNLAVSQMRLETSESLSTSRGHCENVYRRYRDLYGAQHPITLRSHQQLGRIYSELGDHEKALEIHTEVFHGGWSKINSTETRNISRDLITAREDLATAHERVVRKLRQLAKENEAFEEFKKAMRLREEILEHHKKELVDYAGQRKQLSQQNTALASTVEEHRPTEQILLAKNGIATCMAAMGRHQDAYNTREGIIEQYRNLPSLGALSWRGYLKILRKAAKDCESLADELRPQTHPMDNTSDSASTCSPVPAEEAQPTSSPSDSLIDSDDHASIRSSSSQDTLLGISPESAKEEMLLNMGRACRWREEVLKCCQERSGTTPDFQVIQAHMDLGICLESGAREFPEWKSRAYEHFHQALSYMEVPDRLGDDHPKVQELQRRLAVFTFVQDALDPSST